MTTHDDIRAALADVSGEWDFEAVGDEYETTGYLSIGEASIDTVSESIAYDDAYFIANAPAWIRQLLDENARLRSALKWYADADNYLVGRYGEEISFSDVQNDGGERARDALNAAREG